MSFLEQYQSLKLLVDGMAPDVAKCDHNHAAKTRTRNQLEAVKKSAQSLRVALLVKPAPDAPIV